MRNFDLLTLVQLALKSCVRRSSDTHAARLVAGRFGQVRRQLLRQNFMAGVLCANSRYAAAASFDDLEKSELFASARLQNAYRLHQSCCSAKLRSAVNYTIVKLFFVFIRSCCYGAQKNIWTSTVKAHCHRRTVFRTRSISICSTTMPTHQIVHLIAYRALPPTHIRLHKQ